MNGTIAKSIALGGMLAAAMSLNAVAGETKKPAPSATPVITDWSNRHVIFSQPRTAEQAARLQKSIRYQQQQASHAVDPHAPLRIGEEESTISRLRFWKRHHPRWGGRRMHRDWTVDLGSGGTVGAGMYPAKYSFSATQANCGHPPTGLPDFVIYSTGPAGAGTQANLVAETNLYVPCPSGPKPALLWAYQTGGVINTSPVISLDGTQVAFTQTSGGVSSLVLVRWLGFEGDTIPGPGTPATVANASYLGCAAPCMTTFSLGATDSNASVFYDYGTDTAYVGDDSGKLHQYTGVFLGTPAEVTTGWPVTVSTVSGKTRLTSAVHDETSGMTFIADQAGFLYRVDSTGVVTASAQADFGTGFTDGPTVDPSAGAVSVVSSMTTSGGPTAGILQYATNFTAGASPITQAALGTSSSTTPIYNGSFNHDYIFSPSSTGAYWVCGNPGGQPTLYQVSFAGAQVSGALAGPVIGTSTATTCAPTADIYNANLQGSGLPREWAFTSVTAAGTPTPCNGFACVMSFKITPWEPNTTYNVGQEVLDSNLNIQVEENPNGVSGATPPAWGTTTFAPTLDNTARWRRQGVLTAQTPPNWAAGHLYAGAFEIVDANNYIEIAEPTGGTSGGTQPTWPTTEGTVTLDGTVTWYNLGQNPVAALQEPGGTSGIIIDNTANLLGNSQVYFSTLSGGCGMAGADGCAVQASQDGLN